MLKPILLASLAQASLLAVAESEIIPIPPWLQTARELGSFALVAFLVWYFVKYALPQQRQDYIAAEAAIRESANSINQKQREDYVGAQQKQREDYLTASKEQRTDFLKNQAESRADFLAALAQIQVHLDKHADAVQKLAEATYSHVARAEDVWRRQEEQRKRAELTSSHTT